MISALAALLVALLGAAVPAQTAPPASAPGATLLANLRSGQGALTGPMSLVYKCNYQVEGPLRRPHDITSFDAEVAISVRASTVAYSMRVSSNGRQGMPERGLISGGWAYLFSEGAWNSVNALDGIATVHTIGAVLPALVMEGVDEATPTPGKPGSAKLRANTGAPMAAQFDPESMRLKRVEWMRGHRRLGDVTDAVQYADYEMRAGVAVPRTVDALVHEDLATIKVHMELQAAQPAVDLAALNAAESVAPAPPSEPTVEIVSLAPGLWAFTHSGANARCLVQEFDDGWVAFGAPLGGEVSDQVIEAIRKALPNKPLKAVVISHYHPHFIGGLRSFVAAGCDVYVTPGLEPFVKEILARPFTVKPDSLAKNPRTPKIHTVVNRWDLHDGTGSVLMLDVGKACAELDEYLIFYFPAAKLLFEGDLAYVAPKEGLFILNRAPAMVDALKPLGWQIDKILQAWPAQDTQPQEWSKFMAELNAIRARQAPATPPATPPASR